MKDILFYGGSILPLGQRRTPAPEALLVQNGRIAALGDAASLKLQAPGAQLVNLCGAALLPAFIDAHSHLSSCAGALLQLPLANAASFADIADALRRHIAENRIPPGQWVLGADYDHNALAERRHPDKALLDAAAPENPVLLQHASRHVGVLNSAALAALGITGGTPVPEGGVIELSGGQPTGYLAEGAFIACLKRVPMPAMEELLRAYKKAQARYASFGIATVQDGLMPAELLPPYRALLENELLQLDVVGYPDAAALPAYRKSLGPWFGGYRAHFRIGGVKLMLDGSPQARTAWLSRPYVGCTDAERLRAPDSGWCGLPAMTDAQVESALAQAAAEGLQPLAHCNGDAAAAQFLACCEAVERRLPRLKALRPVLIHAQLLRPDQLPLVKRVGATPSYFIAHIYHWGDTHLQNLGSERAQALCPAGSTLALDIPFTFHQDSPVLPPDMLQTVWCAAVRAAKSGTVLGEGERIPVYDALRAVTANAAWQYFEEGQKGVLAPGLRADLTILSRSPLEVEPDALRELEVLATFKDGGLIWAKR